MRVELEHPVANDLQPDAADPPRPAPVRVAPSPVAGT